MQVTAAHLGRVLTLLMGDGWLVMLHADGDGLKGADDHADEWLWLTL